MKGTNELGRAAHAAILPIACLVRALQPREADAGSRADTTAGSAVG